jgi:short-subunit dehydrogenase involved in D-alanine esterification of teichoic acids
MQLRPIGAVTSGAGQRRRQTRCAAMNTSTNLGTGAGSPHGPHSTQRMKEAMGNRLESKVAIVTGAASGIGRECAVALAMEGASVVVADLDIDGAERVSAHIIDRGWQAHAVQVDMGDSGSVESLVQQSIAQFGDLHILHNNAAATHLAAKHDHSLIHI